MKKLEGFLPLLSRLLLSAIFLVSGFAKIVDWDGAAAHMAARGMESVPLFLAAATVIEVVGGAMLLLGLWARHASLALFLYLIPVTIVFHGFWQFEGAQRLAQNVNFMKNLAIMGGLLHVYVFGPGRINLEGRVRLPWRRGHSILSGESHA